MHQEHEVGAVAIDNVAQIDLQIDADHGLGALSGRCALRKAVAQGLGMRVADAE